MKIAVLSDIHGNEIALRRCVEHVLGQGITTFFFLGDYVGDMAYPERTMAFLYDLADHYDCTFIRGNKENYWLNYRADGARGWLDGDSTTGTMLYTYERLTDRDLEFFATLKIERKVSIEGMPKLLLCHGSPYKVNEKMLPGVERTCEIMEECDSSVILCGHTHEHGCFIHNGKCVLNPGSVGVPLYSGGKAQFLILEGSPKGWTHEFWSLDYDVEKVIDDMHQEKMDRHAPFWCRITENLLRKGDMSQGTVLERAMKLCEQESGCCRWPMIPEKYWKQAVEELLV